MKKIKVFLAVNNETYKAYICEAYAKKQMKAAGMNMRLDWNEVESFEKAKNEAMCMDGYDLANCINVTNFTY